MRIRRASIASVSVVAAISGCSTLLDLGNQAADFPDPPFPECEAESYDFVGEGTLGGLGLDETVLPEAPHPQDREARIWVTHDRRPTPQGPRRMLCFEFLPADGSGGSEWPVDDSWRAPGTLDFSVGSVSPTAVSVGVVLALVALVLGVSVVVFGRGDSRADR